MTVCYRLTPLKISDVVEKILTLSRRQAMKQKWYRRLQNSDWSLKSLNKIAPRLVLGYSETNPSDTIFTGVPADLGMFKYSRAGFEYAHQ